MNTTKGFKMSAYGKLDMVLLTEVQMALSVAKDLRLMLNSLLVGEQNGRNQGTT
jgi:hypothetical protein